MDAQELRELTAICGIDCFNCEFFHTNVDDFFAKMPAERKAAFEARGMTIDKVRCQGCRKTGFPCSRLQPLVQGAERVPHNLKVYNLSAIKNRGIEAWAAEAKEIRQRYFRGTFKIGAGPQLAGGK